MKRLENFARAVLEGPSERESDVFALAGGANIVDLLLVVESDRVARFSPETLGGVTQTDGDDLTFPPVILAAQDRVASTVERNLDDLQLTLTTLE